MEPSTLYRATTAGGSAVRLLRDAADERHPLHAHGRSSITLILSGDLEERVGAELERAAPLSVVVKPAASDPVCPLTALHPHKTRSAAPSILGRDRRETPGGREAACQEVTTMRRMCCTIAAATACAMWMLPGEAAAAATPRTMGAWADSLARDAMATGLTPGMSVAVVVDGRITWTAGFGHADRERERPVRPGTRFYIGSTSKALTALAAARLAARGALDLDAPLSRALPGAVFPVGVPAESVRVRDLLTHTHGIDGQGPISLRVAFTGEYTNDELLRLLENHRPARGGREFQYSNLGYDLIGVVLAPAERGGWKEVVEREVTRPLGMTATTAWRSRVPEDSLAQPYELGAHGPERIRLAKEDANMGPAGGHFSTAPDLARLLVAELDGGRVAGRQAIERRVIAETQRLQATQDREFTFFHRHGWGLGWDLGTYDGDTLLHRFGSFAGYRSHVSFMPRRGLGVVVLVNGGVASSTIADAMAAAIYDRLLERAGVRARLAGRLAAAAERGRRIVADLEKRAANVGVLPLPLDAYAGRYASPIYGTLVLEVLDGRLQASMGAARCPAEVFDAAKHQLRVELFGGGSVVTAVLAEDGRSVSALELLETRFDRR